MIFEDPTARRWRSFLIAFFTFLLVGGGLAAAFVAALFVTPPLPDFQHKRNVDKRVRILRDQAQDLSAKQKHGHEVQRKVEDKKGPLLAIPRQGDKLVTAFLVQHDPPEGSEPEIGPLPPLAPPEAGMLIVYSNEAIDDVFGDSLP
jgi:hypothetical protein